VFLVARTFTGAFQGLFIAAAFAAATAVVPPERAGRAMAVVMAGFSVASVIGLPLGLVLARQGSWRTPFFVIAALVAITLVLAAVWMPPLTGHLAQKRAQTPARELLARKEIAFGLATTGFVMLSVFSIVPQIPVYLINNLGYPRDRYELLYLAGGIVSFGVLRFAGRWVDRSGSLPVIVAGTVVALISLATGFLHEPPFVPIMLSFVLFMASGSLRGVAQSTLATKLPAPHERAQYMSLQSAVQHAAGTLGSVVTAVLLTTDKLTKQVSPMWLVALIAMVAAALAPICLAASERYLARRHA